MDKREWMGRERERMREGGREKGFLVCISCEYRSKQCRGPKLPSFRLHSRFVSQKEKGTRERKLLLELPRTISSPRRLFFLPIFVEATSFLP